MVRKNDKGVKRRILSINLIIIVCTASILGLAVNGYYRRISDVTLTTNRFLTTEWHLLQELKSQTDRQLREKDEEIARLLKEYRDYSSGTQAPHVLQSLEQKLKRAEEERTAIIQARTVGQVSFPVRGQEVTTETTAREAPVEQSLGRGPSLEAALPPTDKSLPNKAIISLLQDRIAELENTNADLRASAEAAEEIAALSLTQGALASEPSADRELLLRVRALSATNLRDLPDNASPSRESIRTRALVRALISTPAIRSEYPSILEDFDRSNQDISAQERIKGKRDAWGTISGALGE